MFNPKFILFTCVNLIIFTLGFSDLQPQNIHSDAHRPDEKSKISEENLEYKWRQGVMDEYLDTLPKPKEWVDPYRMMDISLKELKEQLEAKTSGLEKSSNPTVSNKPTVIDKGDTDTITIKPSTAPASTACEKVNLQKEQKGSCALDSIYVTRWVKKLLYRIEKESDKDFSAISFSLDSTIMESLKKMSNAKLFEVSTFDDIISNLLAQAVITRKESFTLSRTYFYYSDTLWLTIYALTICVVVYFLYDSFMRRPKFTTLCCSVVISVFWHWMHLYQQKKAHKHAELASMHIPTQCKKHDLGLLEHINEYVKSFFATNDCSKYYEALLIDPFWEVSFSVAVSEAVTAFVFQPLSAASRALNFFIKQLFDGLPIHLTLALIIFIFILAIMMCNYSPSILFCRMEPRPAAITGSRVEEVQQSAPRKILTEAIRNVASSIQNESVEAILAESSTTPKSVQYNSGNGAKMSNLPKASQSVASRVNLITAAEDELAMQSGYFDARNSVQCRYSKLEVDVNVKKTVLPTETISKRFSTGDNSKVDFSSKTNSMDTTKDISSSNPIQLHLNNAEKNLDGYDELEASNLLESPSDSFEVLPALTDDNIEESRFCTKGRAGPNCDSSMGILEEMHKSCKICN